MAGLSAAGFTAKTLPELKTELEDGFRAAFGDSIDVSPESVFGQIIGVHAERLAELWELAETVNSEFNPDNATGARLDALAGLTGTLREAAKHSTASIVATGDAGTVLALGRVVSVLGTGVRFATDAGATIAAVSAWANSTPYVVGDRVKNGSSPARVYQCTDAGTSAAGPATGPSGTGSNIVDGGCEWKHLGEGAACVDVAVTAEETGPLIAAADSLSVIESPVAGWKGAINLLDAELGADLESDPSLRLRREDEIRGGAKGVNAAIRAAILKVEGVESCTVFGNRTMSTNGDGLPPKSVECLVLGGADADVRKAVFENVAEGIESYGTNSGTVTDSDGVVHTVKFSRPNEIPIYVTIYVEKFDQDFPPDGEDQIKAAIVALGNTYKTGKDVVANALRRCAFYNPVTKTEIPGTLNASPCYIGTSPAPWSESTIVMGTRDLPRFDTSRVSVVLSSGTP